MAGLQDLTGEKFGQLRVLKRGPNYRIQPQWVCACDCGNEVLTRGDKLRYGKTTSCGCSQTNPPPTRSGHVKRRYPQRRRK